MSRLQAFLARLKQRKMVQWALAYLAGVWLILQLVDVLAEPLGIALTVQRGFLLVLSFGFVVALVVAWYHEEQGRHRVSGPELLIIAGLLAITGLVLGIMRGGDRRSEVACDERSRPERPGVAVLPFENISANPDDAYFAEGMHEQIISQLSKISALRVISRTSVMEYGEVRTNITAIAAELDVGFVLEGSARRDRDQVRLTTQLIDGCTDEHLWTEEYDRDLSVAALFEIQDDLAERVASSLSATILPAESEAIARHPTAQLGAYDAYLLGRHHWNTVSPEGLQRAIGYFETAIEIDPEFAEAHSGLADAYARLPGYTDASVEASYAKARASARRALALDSTLAEVQRTYATVVEMFDWNFAAGEARLRKAIEISPSYAPARMSYAVSLVAREREVEAETEIQELVALDPGSFGTLSNIGFVYLVLRRYPEALRFAAEARGVDPRHEDSYWVTGLTLHAMNRSSEAVSTLKNVITDGGWLEKVTDDLPAARAGFRAYVAANRDPSALQNWREAHLSGVVQDREIALTSLEALYAKRSPLLRWVVQFPTMDFIHSDPRFKEIVEELQVVLDRRLAR